MSLVLLFSIASRRSKCCIRSLEYSQDPKVKAWHCEWTTRFSFLLTRASWSCDGLMLRAPQVEIDYVSTHIVDLAEEKNEFQEYFDYARESLGIGSPTKWQEALNLYHTLMHAAANGHASAS